MKTMGLEKTTPRVLFAPRLSMMDHPPYFLIRGY